MKHRVSEKSGSTVVMPYFREVEVHSIIHSV